MKQFFRFCIAVLLIAGIGACVRHQGEQAGEAGKTTLVQPADTGQATAVQTGAPEPATKKDSTGRRHTQLVEPVSFTRLEALLPDSIAGLVRKDMKGEKTGAMGYQISSAHATYRVEASDSRLKIAVTDAGGARSLVGIGPWAMVDFDRESKNSYARSFSFKGWKAYQQYHRKREDGEINVLVANRFIVEITGRNVSETTLRAALDSLDLEGLAALKSGQ